MSADAGPSSEPPRRWRRHWRVLAGLVVVALAVTIPFLLGVNIGHSIDAVWAQVGHVPPQYLALGCLLTVLQTFLVAISWQGVLRGIYPEEAVTLKLTFGANQSRAATDALVPANAGLGTLLGLYRLFIPDSRIATLIGAEAVQSLPFIAFALINYAYLFATLPTAIGSPSALAHYAIAFLAAHLALTAAALAVLMALAVAAVRFFKHKIEALWEQIVLGGAIFHQPRAYLLRVLLPSILSYIVRWGQIAVFMAATGIPVDLRAILLVAGAHQVAGVLPITPGSIGTTAVLNVLVLRDFAPTSTIIAYSVTQTAVVSIFNVLFALLVLIWAFGWTTTKHLITHRREIRSQPTKHAHG